MAISPTSASNSAKSINERIQNNRKNGLYTIQAGETLTSIAKKFGFDNYQDFATQYGIKSSDIKSGHTLKNLPTVTFDPKKSTLYSFWNTSIKNQYNISWKDFCTLNNIDPDHYTATGVEKFFVKGNVTTAQKPIQSSNNTANKNPAITTTKTTPTPVQTNSGTKTTAPSNVDNKKQWGSDYSPNELAQALSNAVDGNKGAVGKAVFDDLLKQINKKNASEVFRAYDEISPGESLLEAIVDETSSDKESRKNAIMHIYHAVVEQKELPYQIEEIFVEELNNQFDSFGFASTKKLDKTMRLMTATPEELAAALEDAVDSSFGAVGKKDFEQALLMVTPLNVTDVIEAYNKLNTGETLINAITSEVSSDKDSRKKACIFLYDNLSFAKRHFNDEERAKFIQILDDEFDSFGMVDTKELDKIINNLTQMEANPILPKANTPAEERRNDILRGVRINLYERFYHDEKDSNGNIKTPSFINQLITRIKNDPNLSDAEKEAQIQRAKNAKLNVYTVERDIPTLDSRGRIKNKPEVNVSYPQKPNGKVIIVNSGHGGFTSNAFDGGAFSYYECPEGSNIYRPLEEYMAIKPFAEKLTDQLLNEGYTVVQVSGTVNAMQEHKTIETLTTEYSQKYGNSNVGFVSLHCDSINPTHDGTKVCFNDANDEKFARTIVESFNEDEFKIDSLPRTKKNGNSLFVLNTSKVDAILVEIENLAGINGTKVLDSEYQDDFVTALTRGINIKFGR